MKEAEQKQTWYLPIGSAVHVAIEAHLKGEPYDLDQIFYDLIKRQMAIESDTSSWLHGGSDDEPVVEERALKRAQECLEKGLEFVKDIEVWEIEYDASGSLPGLSIPIKAFIDIMGGHKKYGPVILDWKTGRQKPKDNFQLETYQALLLEREWLKDYTSGKQHTFTGLWAMLAPQASKARPVDLSNVSPKDVGAKYQAVYEKMQQKLYPTQAGYNCRFCFHQENCKLNAGRTPRALYYDTAEEDGYPF
jgi:CRISPR/Cas system-associated exonuclease Cas4 (RecB family)